MSELTSVVDIPRDYWGRPKIIPPNGGNPVAYTRCTTFVGAIEDTYNLAKWQQRMVALGLARRADLLLSVTAHPDDKGELDRVCEAAREAAAASAAATTGTALHSLTETLDRGHELPALPAGAKASLDAYGAATKDLRHVHIERFTVLDALQIGGTPDRVVEFEGQRYIADLKTGSIDFGALKIAAQLAVYSRSWLYEPDGTRTAHEASTTRGIVIHLPATDDPAGANCELHWIDLEQGWEAVKANKQVRELRKIKFAQLTKPFGPVDQPSLRLEKRDETKAADRAHAEIERIKSLIDNCATADLVRAVWASNEASWTDALTTYAKSRIAALPAAS